MKGGEWMASLEQSVVEEKIRLSKSTFPQMNFDIDDYNQRLSKHMAESIATALEQDLAHSKLLEYSREPFKLGKIIELIRSINILSFQTTSTTDHTFRKNVGMFYTPEPIVEYIVKKTLQRWFERLESIEKKCKNTALDAWMNLRIIDPACGTGSFLIVTAKHLVREYELFSERCDNSIPNIDEYKKRLLTQILHGVDIDPIAVRLCKANLRYHLGLGVKYEPRVVCGDSLTAPLFPDPQFKPLEDWPEPIIFAEQFTDVFDRDDPGFDILIMNPPYGKLRAESGKGVRKNKEKDFGEKKRYEILRKHIRESKMYPHSKGVLNWYKLFIERSLHLLNENGSMGFIVPSTLLCDDSTKELRKALLRHELSYLLEIPEKNKFFDSVTQSYSIGILNIDKRTNKTDFRFGVKSMDQVHVHQEGVILKDIADLTEKSFSIPLTTETGLNIYLKMHQNQTISKIKEIINKRGEIDLTTFKSCLSSSPGDGKVRLLRGKDVRFCRLEKIGENDSLIDSKKALEKLGDSEKVKHLSMKRLVCQQIANQNNSDRLIFAMIDENMFCGNSLNYVFWNGEDAETWNYVLLGLLNSTLLDWRFKITSTNNHVNNYEIDELPLPIGDTNGTRLGDRLIEISTIARKLEVCDSRDTKNLKNKMDMLVFKLYKLTNNEIKFVLKEMGATTEEIKHVLEVKANG